MIAATDLREPRVPAIATDDAADDSPYLDPAIAVEHLDALSESATPSTRVDLDHAQWEAAAGWCEHIVAEVTAHGVATLESEDAAYLAQLIAGYNHHGRAARGLRIEVRKLVRQRAIAMKEMSTMLDVLQRFGWNPDPRKSDAPTSEADRDAVQRVFARARQQLVTAAGYLWRCAGLTHPQPITAEARDA